MAEITPQMIKELRERTGVGVAKCKEALEKTNGNIDQAIEDLRKAGMASAVKKAERDTKEGQIAFANNGSTIGLVEVNAETDFVVRNDRFQEFVKNIAEEVAKTKPANLESFLAQKYSKEPNLTIDQYRATIVQVIGENIQIKRIQTLEQQADKSIGLYSHLGGKIVTAVEITGDKGQDDLARDVAMHVAAAEPTYLNPSQVPQTIIDQEKDIAKTQLKGKPENIIDKILTGKIEAYFNQVCLTRQPYIRDDSKTVEAYVAERAKTLGKPLTLANFLRWKVGQ
jgi:elongation factor Ts